MIFNALNVDGAEGAQPDVQRDEAEIDAACRQIVELLLSEMQTGGRSGGGTSDAIVDGLITFGVVESLMNVGRQRSLAEPIENFFKDAVEMKLDNPPAEIRPLDHRARQFVAEH